MAQLLFWDRFYSLCLENKTTPTNVVKTIGISHGATTKWKNGTNPNADVLVKIARYFGVSIDYLMGVTDEKQKILKVISLDDIDDIEGDTLPPDTVVGFNLIGTEEQIEKAEAYMKKMGGKYYKGEPIEIDETDEKNKATPEEQPISEIEQELLELTADMDEDEKNALLGYAARLISKRKKED